MRAAVDQLEHLLELTHKATGELSLPLLKDSERLRRRLRRKFKGLDYPSDALENAINDIVEFHEACRKFLQIIDTVLEERSDPHLIRHRLGNAIARLGSWERRLASMSRSLVRLGNFLSDKVALREKARGNRS